MREGVTERHAPVGNLAGEVAGDVLRPVVGAHRDAARRIGADPAEALGECLADRLQRGETAAVGRDVVADDLGVEVIEGGEDPNPAVLEFCTMLASVPQSTSGASVRMVPSWSLAGRGGRRYGESSWFSRISRSTRDCQEFRVLRGMMGWKEPCMPRRKGPHSGCPA